MPNVTIGRPLMVSDADGTLRLSLKWSLVATSGHPGRIETESLPMSLEWRLSTVYLNGVNLQAMLVEDEVLW